MPRLHLQRAHVCLPPKLRPQPVRRARRVPRASPAVVLWTAISDRRSAHDSLGAVGVETDSLTFVYPASENRKCSMCMGRARRSTLVPKRFASVTQAASADLSRLLLTFWSAASPITPSTRRKMIVHLTPAAAAAPLLLASGRNARRRSVHGGTCRAPPSGPRT